MYNRDSEIDMEMVASFLKNAVNKVKTQENPDLLNDLKKIYKKNACKILDFAGYQLNKGAVQKEQSSSFIFDSPYFLVF